jgi:prevent-host-death family protein
MKTWNATDAKRHFSEVIAGAETAPQVVLLRGRPVGVVVSYERFVLI